MFYSTKNKYIYLRYFYFVSQCAHLQAQRQKIIGSVSPMADVLRDLKYTVDKESFG